MIKSEAITYINSLVATPVNMITLDPVKWADFKASMLTFLNAPSSDPKYEATLRAIDALDNAALK
jgi:hypothetical protein